MIGYGIAFAPLLPWALIAVAAALGAAILAFGAWRRARGTLWRLAALAILLAAIADPSLIEEQRQAQKDVALIVKDVSPKIGRAHV